MSWTDPAGHVYTTGEVVTAATLNTYVKDNLLDLSRRTTAVTGYVATSQATTSTTYVDLATAGPAATVTIGSYAAALVCLSSAVTQSAAGFFALMNVAISGASSIGASDAGAIGISTTTSERVGSSFLFAGLTAGSNTFTCKYRVSSASTGTFGDRLLAVLPQGN